MSPRRWRPLLAGLGALGLVLLLAGPLGAQCSMCQQVVAQSPEAQKMGAQLNHAILLMFFAPYLLFTSFMLFVFRARVGRRLRSWVRIFFLPR
jgi:hypothetical protein